MATEQNIFFEGLRRKLRFDTPRGQINIEDLIGLPLQSKTANGVSLDSVGIQVKRQLKDAEEQSLVAPRSAANSELQLKLDIIMYAIDVKKAESAKRKKAADARAELESLKAIAASKQQEAVANQPLEEIQARIKALSSELSDEE